MIALVRMSLGLKTAGSWSLSGSRIKVWGNVQGQKSCKQLYLLNLILTLNELDVIHSCCQDMQ